MLCVEIARSFGGDKMEWLLRLVVLWLSLDIVLVATAWYAITTIKPRWPNWWEQAVVGVEPEFNYHRRFTAPKAKTRVP
jgi:hypothetical protein